MSSAEVTSVLVIKTKAQTWHVAQEPGTAPLCVAGLSECANKQTLVCMTMSNQEEVFLCNSKPGSQVLASPGKGKLPPGDQQTLQASQCQSLRNMNIRSPLPIPISLSHPLPQPQRVSLSLCHPGSPTTRSVDKTGLKLKDPPASASWELKSWATIPAPSHPRCPSPVRQAPGQAGGQPFSHSSRRTHLRHWGLTTPGTGGLLVSLDPCTQQKPRTQPLLPSHHLPQDEGARVFKRPTGNSEDSLG